MAYKLRSTIMYSKLVKTQQYFVLIFVLCLVLLLQNGLTEKIVLKELIFGENLYNLYSSDYNQDSHGVENPFENNAGCVCMGGYCVLEDGEDVCKCPPGYGNFTERYCKDCNCGKDTSCYWNPGFFGDKVCLCKPGYKQKGLKCEECDCGPYGSCMFKLVNQNTWKKVCYCERFAVEKNGQCVAVETTSKTTNDWITTTLSTTEKVIETTSETTNNWITTTVSTTEKECNCGPYGSCSYESGKKRCYCEWFAVEMDGLCIVMETTSETTYDWLTMTLSTTEKDCNCGPYGSCQYENGRKRCNCEWFAVEMNGLCVVRKTTITDALTVETTLISSTTKKDCNCGENSKACSYDSNGFKLCYCYPGYAENYGVCEECDCGPHGSCSFKYGRKTCSCIPFHVQINGKCLEMRTSTEEATDTSTTSTFPSSTVKDCSCGENSKSCRYNMLGEKECNCSTAYAQNRGYCEECNCGPYGSCSFEYDRKRCNCKSFAVENNGVCVFIESTTPEDTTTAKTTEFPTTIKYCSCGEYSKSCRYDWLGNKLCDCYPGYAENYGSCKECNCGPYGSCSFTHGKKTCNCIHFHVESNGVCVEIGTSTEETTDSITTSTFSSTTTQAICSEDKCVNGKCEISRNGFKCRCNEGFIGLRCEEKIQIKSNIQDILPIAQFSIIFAMFTLLLGIFCFLVCKFYKRTEK